MIKDRIKSTKEKLSNPQNDYGKRYKITDYILSQKIGMCQMPRSRKKIPSYLLTKNNKYVKICAVRE